MKSPNRIKKWSIAYRVEVLGTIEVDAVDRLGTIAAFDKIKLQMLFDKAKDCKTKLISSCPMHDDKEGS